MATVAIIELVRGYIPNIPTGISILRHDMTHNVVIIPRKDLHHVLIVINSFPVSLQTVILFDPRSVGITANRYL